MYGAGPPRRGAKFRPMAHPSYDAKPPPRGDNNRATIRAICGTCATRYARSTIRNRLRGAIISGLRETRAMMRNRHPRVNLLGPGYARPAKQRWLFGANVFDIRCARAMTRTRPIGAQNSSFEARET